MDAKPIPTWPSEVADLPQLCFAAAASAPFPTAMVDEASHVVRFVNPAFCQIFGKSEEEMLGRPFSEFVPANDASLSLLDRVLRTGKPAAHMEEEHWNAHPLFWSYTVWPITVDDHPFGIMIQVSESAQLHDKTIAMNEALMVASMEQHELVDAADASNALLQTEIHDHQQAEEALIRAQTLLTDRAAQLEETVSARTAELTATTDQMEAFVYSIAHDLRAPLQALQIFSTLLTVEAGTASAKGKHYAASINKSARFMDAMLVDLLAFSAISQQNVELTAVCLRTVVESVLFRLEKSIHDKGARIEAPELWPSVWAHDSTLVQVLFNLMSNALKFVPEGRQPIIRLSWEQEEEVVRVWVEDNGVGIAPDHCDKVFQLFARLEGNKYEGTGIGLAIVQKGIARMEGRVGVQSIPGKGSGFWFELRQSP